MSGLVSFIGVVHPWMCDVMGHMNVRHYAGMFDDASFQLLGHIAGKIPDEGFGWADVALDYGLQKGSARRGFADDPLSGAEGGAFINHVSPDNGWFA